MPSSAELKEALVRLAKKYVGTREEAKNSGKQVEAFQKAVDEKALGEPWCMAFVQFCIAEIEKETRQKSNIFRSEHVLQVWNETEKTLRRKTPEPGNVVIWRRRGTTSGHAGIVVCLLSPEVMQTVEGNTSGESGIQREGDGVYLRSRRLAGTTIFELMGYLSPF